MTAVLIILLILALIFGVGSVLEGIAWAMLIAIVLLAVAGFLAWRKFRDITRSG